MVSRSARNVAMGVSFGICTYVGNFVGNTAVDIATMYVKDTLEEKLDDNVLALQKKGSQLSMSGFNAEVKKVNTKYETQSRNLNLKSAYFHGYVGGVTGVATIGSAVLVVIGGIGMYKGRKSNRFNIRD